MKTTPLPEILKQITPLPYSTKRIHPCIDVGNGDGPQPMPEISAELPSGNWQDVGYSHSKADRDYLAHAANVLPELVEALREAIVALDMDDNFGDDIDARHAAEEKAFLVCSSALSLATNVPVNS